MSSLSSSSPLHWPHVGCHIDHSIGPERTVKKKPNGFTHPYFTCKVLLVSCVWIVSIEHSLSITPLRAYPTFQFLVPSNEPLLSPSLRHLLVYGRVIFLYTDRWITSTAQKTHYPKKRIIYHPCCFKLLMDFMKVSHSFNMFFLKYTSRALSIVYPILYLSTPCWALMVFIIFIK